MRQHAPTPPASSLSKARPAFVALFAIALIALGGCASTPREENGVVNGGGPIPRTLNLCAGVSISNAPAARASRQVIAFTPEATVRGRVLLRAPVAACVSSGFGPRRGGAGPFHHGLDLYTGEPRSIVAAGDGRIIRARSVRGYGRTVDIDHGRGVVTRYAHLSAYAAAIRPGARVTRGAVIGATGASGNATAVHLHYEIRIDGIALDPLRIELDPRAD